MVINILVLKGRNNTETPVCANDDNNAVVAYQYQKLIVCDVDCSPTEPFQGVH